MRASRNWGRRLGAGEVIDVRSLSLILNINGFQFHSFMVPLGRHETMKLDLS